MNHINNIETLEKEMVELLSLSLSQPFSKKDFHSHSIRITEASKSIIGLNLENPNKNIINFINGIKLHPYQESKESAAQYDSGTISIYQLKEAIIESDSEKVNDILDNLLQLSDGKHILEYLVELSLEQTGNSLLVIWPIYKAINFIGYRNRNSIKNAISGACQSLIFDEFRVLKKDKGIRIENIPLNSIEASEQLHTLGVLHEINNFEFIRKNLINENATLFASFFYNQKNKEFDESHDLEVSNAGEQIDILNILDDMELSKESILSLNALRSISKYSNLTSKDARRFLDLITRCSF